MRLPRKLAGLPSKPRTHGHLMVATQTYPGYWGKGATLQEAWENLRRSGGDSSMPVAVLEVPEGAYCCEVTGSLRWDIPEGMTREDARPIKVYGDKPMPGFED